MQNERPIKRLGYVRISADYPSASSQLRGIQIDKTFEDRDPVTDISRPVLARCIDSLEPNDILYVQSGNRIAENFPELAKVVNAVLDRKAVIRFLDEGFGFGENAGSGEQHNVLKVSCAFYESFKSGAIEMEKESLLDGRTPSKAWHGECQNPEKPAFKTARRKRSRNLSDTVKKEICRLSLNGVSGVHIANSLGIHRNTVYNVLDEMGLSRRKQRSKKSSGAPKAADIAPLVNPNLDPIIDPRVKKECELRRAARASFEKKLSKKG